MDFTLYGDDSKGLIRLDPRTKLLIFLASSLVSVNTNNSTTLLFYAVSICTVLALCGKGWTALKSICVFFVVYYLQWCVKSTLSSAPAVSIVLSALTTIVLFAFPMLLSFLLLVQTTRTSQFLSAFQAMKLPMKAIIPVAVIFRFIPTVQDEWNGIRKAMAFRGVRLDLGSILKAPFKTIECVLIPMLFSTVSVMEELTAAALARGMDVDGKRSAYEEVKLRPVDYFVIAVFLGLILWIFLSKSKTGG